MVRVCASVLFSLLALCGCASEQLQAPVNAQLQAKVSAEKENILACTGLPLAGQKCGLGFLLP